MASFWKNKRVTVTGGAGFLGSWIVEELISRGAKREDILVPRRKDYDLRDRDACKKVTEGRDIVIHCAVNGGGIGYNRTYPGSIFYDNLIMDTELMEASRINGVKKFVGINTICAYPKITSVPFTEENLWQGYPEETNAPYGLSKKMMIPQAEGYKKEYGFLALNPLLENMYGPRDDFDDASSHVIPALIKKFDTAMKDKDDEAIVWGTGKATRGFLFVKDAARAVVSLAEIYDDPTPINIGSGSEISIKELVDTIAGLMEYKGRIVWDTEKPDGQPRRSVDTSKAISIIGEFATTQFEKGLKETIDWWYQDSKNSAQTR
ncbi:GDP-L-fucose synthase [Candidatus Microgenomates bacterium]|nr:GDP-L-fucose synthase [Candidatus Microgenomates bacterium]